MPVPAESKPALLTLLMAWPVAAVVGLAIGRAVHADWPVAALPFGWLLVVAWVLRGYASRSR